MYKSNPLSFLINKTNLNFILHRTYMPEVIALTIRFHTNIDTSTHNIQLQSHFGAWEHLKLVRHLLA